MSMSRPVCAVSGTSGDAATSRVVPTDRVTDYNDPMSVEPRIIGNLVLAARSIAEERLGPEPVLEAIGRAPEPARKSYELITPLHWVLVEHVDQVTACIARAAGQDPVEWNEWVSREATYRTMARIHRLLLRLAEPGALVKRVPILYRKTMDTGSLGLVSTDMSREEAHLRLMGWPSISRIQLAGIAGGIESGLRLTRGGRTARASWSRNSDGGDFVVRWTDSNGR